MFYQELLNDFVVICKEIIGNQLTGIYLHGSMAMGCFNADKSDIDIIVIDEGITDEQKISLMKQIVKLNRNAPSKGLEISFIKKEYCKPFVYPTPFELHFSSMYLQWFNDNPKDYVNKMKGEDKDLAAHFTIIKECGVRLYGKEIGEVFGDVPRKDYIDSIWYDIENATEDILENPLYIILNLCRVLAYLRDKIIISKEKGGEWGLLHLDEKYHLLIQQAQQCYKSNQPIQINETIAKQFANDMLKEIKCNIDQI